MDLRETAKKLLKMAALIEKEAAENTYFVCSECLHTASLQSINEKRSKLASEEDPEMVVKTASVNDKVSCPACDGVMSYVATDESERYYVAQEEAPEEVVEEEDSIEEVPAVPGEEYSEDSSEEGLSESDVPSDEDIDAKIDEIFEDVETQDQKRKEEQGIEEPEEETAIEEDEVIDEVPDAEDTEEDIPEEDSEEDAETVEEEEDVKPAKKPVDKPDDGKANTEKKDVPMFKSKEAEERFASSVQRYSL